MSSEFLTAKEVKAFFDDVLAKLMRKADKRLPKLDAAAKHASGKLSAWWERENSQDGLMSSPPGPSALQHRRASSSAPSGAASTISTAATTPHRSHRIKKSPSLVAPTSPAHCESLIRKDCLSTTLKGSTNGCEMPAPDAYHFHASFPAEELVYCFNIALDNVHDRKWHMKKESRVQVLKVSVGGFAVLADGGWLKDTITLNAIPGSASGVGKNLVQAALELLVQNVTSKRADVTLAVLNAIEVVLSEAYTNTNATLFQVVAQALFRLHICSPLGEVRIAARNTLQNCLLSIQSSVESAAAERKQSVLLPVLLGGLCCTLEATRRANSYKKVPLKMSPPTTIMPPAPQPRTLTFRQSNLPSDKESSPLNKTGLQPKGGTSPELTTPRSGAQTPELGGTAGLGVAGRSNSMPGAYVADVEHALRAKFANPAGSFAKLGHGPPRRPFHQQALSESNIVLPQGAIWGQEKRSPKYSKKRSSENNSPLTGLLSPRSPGLPEWEQIGEVMEEEAVFREFSQNTANALEELHESIRQMGSTPLPPVPERPVLNYFKAVNDGGGGTALLANEQDLSETLLASHPEQHDLFRLIRTLCALGCDDVSRETEQDSPKVHGRVFALELLLFIFESAGEGFQESSALCSLIKNHIANVVLVNLACTRPSALFLTALKIFRVCLKKFLRYMKAELACILVFSILPAARTTSCSFEQRIAILNMLELFVPDILKLFLLNDCSDAGVDVVKEIVLTLTFLATHQFVHKERTTYPQSTLMRGKSAEILAQIIVSLQAALALPLENRKIRLENSPTQDLPDPSEDPNEGEGRKESLRGRRRSSSAGFSGALNVSVANDRSTAAGPWQQTPMQTSLVFSPKTPLTADHDVESILADSQSFNILGEPAEPLEKEKEHHGRFKSLECTLDMPAATTLGRDPQTKDAKEALNIRTTSPKGEHSGKPKSVPQFQYCRDLDHFQSYSNKWIMRRVVDAYRNSWKEGLKHLVGYAVLHDKRPSTVAAFLFHNAVTYRLDPSQTGDMLLRNKPWNHTVLIEYLQLYDMRGLSLDMAMRRILSQFLPCGESQIMDRLMMSIVSEYAAQNEHHPIVSPDGKFQKGLSVMLPYQLLREVVEKKQEEGDVVTLQSFDDLASSTATSITDKATDTTKSYRGGIYAAATPEPESESGPRPVSSRCSSEGSFGNAEEADPGPAYAVPLEDFGSKQTQRYPIIATLLEDSPATESMMQVKILPDYIESEVELKEEDGGAKDGAGESRHAGKVFLVPKERVLKLDFVYLAGTTVLIVNTQTHNKNVGKADSQSILSLVAMLEYEAEGVISGAACEQLLDPIFKTEITLDKGYSEPVWLILWNRGKGVMWGLISCQVPGLHFFFENIYENGHERIFLALGR